MLIEAQTLGAGIGHVCDVALGAARIIVGARHLERARELKALDTLRGETTLYLGAARIYLGAAWETLSVDLTWHNTYLGRRLWRERDY